MLGHASPMVTMIPSRSATAASAGLQVVCIAPHFGPIFGAVKT